ncbi:hypothetical protein [Paludisphaera rhizosphaerae]|uniref:hypothetical protein n=1 Tax=Paludisphaera rhizosphaerae TaxID=2711216 RepID=UPI0013E9C2C8|nr:hypothetical protein [Paludisphaera rhizosphaerae]
MNTRPSFTFPGLWPYIARAGEGRDLPFLGRAVGLWHCKQVQDALGQLPGLDADSRASLLEHVAEVRDSLAATLEGIDLAVRETTEALDATPNLIAEPPPASSPKRKRG